MCNTEHNFSVGTGSEFLIAGPNLHFNFQIHVKYPMRGKNLTAFILLLSKELIMWAGSQFSVCTRIFVLLNERGHLLGG